MVDLSHTSILMKKQVEKEIKSEAQGIVGSLSSVEFAVLYSALSLVPVRRILAIYFTTVGPAYNLLHNAILQEQVRRSTHAPGN
jgi:hypothetical protein